MRLLWRLERPCGRSYIRTFTIIAGQTNRWPIPSSVLCGDLRIERCVYQLDPGLDAMDLDWSKSPSDSSRVFPWPRPQSTGLRAEPPPEWGSPDRHILC